MVFMQYELWVNVAVAIFLGTVDWPMYFSVPSNSAGSLCETQFGPVSSDKYWQQKKERFYSSIVHKRFGCTSDEMPVFCFSFFFRMGNTADAGSDNITFRCARSASKDEL